MKTKIKHIATIQTGVFAKPITDGKIVYLQAKHFDIDGNLTNTLYPDLSNNSKIEKHILYSDDILFAAKGTKNFAACYESINIPAVASTSFFVIRLKDSNILPQYLKWYLNHPDTKSFLKSKAKGTSIASISKVVLQELELNIPSLQKQNMILQIDELFRKKKKLKHKIEQLQEKQIQHQLINATK